MVFLSPLIYIPRLSVLVRHVRQIYPYSQIAARFLNNAGIASVNSHHMMDIRAENEFLFPLNPVISLNPEIVSVGNRTVHPFLLLRQTYNIPRGFRQTAAR